jgi:acyl-coenzyme A thioesterase PaaI-like protein
MNEIPQLPPDFRLAVPLDQSFDAVLGLEYGEITESRATATLKIRDGLRNAQGHVGSAVFAAAAEGLASMATALQVIPRGMVAAGRGNHTSVLAPAPAGTVEFRADRIGVGETWVWRVAAVGEDGVECAYSIVTVAVRPES